MASRAGIFREKTTRGRVARGLRAALVALLSAWALYVVGINVFFSTSLFAKVFEGAREDVVIHYARGWSVWPGTIHARDLEIRGQDSNVAWDLHLDRIVFDVSFAALARQRFTVGRARGSGITFRARRTRDARPVTLEEIADLPPIAERAAYEVSPSGPPSLERWSDDHYHLWTVDLEDVRAEDVREIWIDQGHFVGHASIDGRFHLKPIRAFDVGPATVTIHDGRVLEGANTLLLEQLAGTATLTIDGNDPRTLQGTDILHFLSLSTDLRGRSADLAGVPLLAVDGFSSSGNIDLAALVIGVDHGLLRTAHVDASSPALGTTRRGLRATTGMRLLADVAIGRLASSVALHDLVLARSDGERVFAVPALALSADATTLDLADHPLRDLHAALDVPAVDVADTRRLDALLPNGVPFAPGAGVLRGKAHVEAWRADARIAASATLDGHLAVRIATENVRSALHLDASLDANADHPRAATLREAVFDLRDVGLSHGAQPAVTAKRISGSVRGVPLADPLTHGALAVKIERAEVHDGSALESFLPAGATWGLASDRGRFDADLALAVDRHVAHGHLNAKAERMGVSTKRGAVWGDATVALALDRWAIDAGTVALAPSSVELANVHGRLPQSIADDLTARRIVLTGRASELSMKAPDVAGVDAHLVVDDIALPDARSLDRLLPGGSAIRIDAGSARLNGAIAIGNDRATGALTVDVARGAVTVGKTQLTGDFTVEAALHGFDGTKKALDLAGSRLVLKNVAITGGKTQAWSGLLVAKSAALRFPTGGPDLEALVWLEADDARPLLGAVLDSGLPKLLSGLVSMPRLRGRARLHFGPHVLQITDVEAAGGDVALRGAFGIHDDERRGAFVVEKGPVSVGLRLDDAGTHPRLFGLDGWLTNELREDADRAARNAETVK